jgi:hypothetical protein
MSAKPPEQSEKKQAAKAAHRTQKQTAASMFSQAMAYTNVVRIGALNYLSAPAAVARNGHCV